MNDIVLVSSVGDYWVTAETARKVALEMQKGTAYVTINGNMIACNAIRGLLQPDRYKTQAINARRNWVCRRGTGHAFDSICDCKDPVKVNLDKSALAATNPLTPEQQAEKDRLGRANREWIRLNKPNWKKIADKKARQAFIDKFEKTVEKPLTSH